ncbi:MAG: RibD family protein [Desulfobacterales bacterium]|nr:RibD family protein [Desulfobacterales bacterium]
MKVAIIAACSLDGKITPGPIGSKEDRRFLEEMRLETDAGILGAGTLRKDDPQMLGPNGCILENRIRAIISLTGNIPLSDKRLFENGPVPIIYTAGKMSASLETTFDEKAEIVGLPANQYGLCIQSVLKDLENRGASSVLIEGGGGLNYSCLAQGVVDEMLVTVSPSVNGGKDNINLLERNKMPELPQIKLDFVSCIQNKSGEVFLRYSVRKD